MRAQPAPDPPPLPGEQTYEVSLGREYMVPIHEVSVAPPRAPQAVPRPPRLAPQAGRRQVRELVRTVLARTRARVAALGRRSIRSSLAAYLRACPSLPSRE